MTSGKRNVKLYIFDADGTLRRSTVRGRPVPNTENEWKLLPNVKEKIQEILSKETDAIVAIASNQGGVELGYLSRKQARRLLNDLYKEITGRRPPRGMVQLCPDFNKPSSCRKPNPGMLMKIMKQASVSSDESLFVGDRKDDQLTAKNAGVSFIAAKDFFGWGR
jgi:D-glycero-D-manno-heptose 1,7-bisphosphate phosphatase